MTDDGIGDVLAALGPRLRTVRERHGATLSDVGRATGVPLSTLSRFENGRRTPGLAMLLRLAQVYGVSLDELTGTDTDHGHGHDHDQGTESGAAAAVSSPKRNPPRTTAPRRAVPDKAMVPLTRYVGGLHAHKHVLPARGEPPRRPAQVSHEGYEWLCVLYGKLWLALGGHDLVLTAGEVVEFDTRTAHGLANAAPDEPVEYLIMFGPQGERLRQRTPPGGRPQG
ncbi:helix-turn-helix domain-containing protein [Streptodolium elevatio]|uniref:Helix-turn-helix domain-containing protein n=1 Tax=Streptodolium elevatio TaxID=3157996 RepID=A0ABV3DCL4_9ACTN